MMRFPQCSEIEKNEQDESYKETKIPSGLHLLSETPSLSGMAFACTAAALPLLQSQNPITGCAVARLLAVSIPLLLEPRRSGCLDVVELNALRLQHLLNRFEQVTSSVYN